MARSNDLFTNMLSAVPRGGTASRQFRCQVLGIIPLLPKVMLNKLSGRYMSTASDRKLIVDQVIKSTPQWERYSFEKIRPSMIARLFQTGKKSTIPDNLLFRFRNPVRYLFGHKDGIDVCMKSASDENSDERRIEVSWWLYKQSFDIQRNNTTGWTGLEAPVKLLLDVMNEEKAIVVEVDVEKAERMKGNGELNKETAYDALKRCYTIKAGTEPEVPQDVRVLVRSWRSTHDAQYQWVMGEGEGP